MLQVSIMYKTFVILIIVFKTYNVNLFKTLIRFYKKVYHR